jgi:hypothetical protein
MKIAAPALNLQSRRMIQECPRDTEFFGQMRRQRFHTECFCIVMAAVKNVEAKLLRQCVSPVRAFAGDKRVHSFANRLFQFRPRSASDHTNVPANFSASGNDAGFRAGRLRNPSGQFRTGNRHPRFETYCLAVSQKKWPQISKAQRGAQLRIIPQPRVRVERQVGTVNRQIVFDKQPEQFASFARPRMRWRPEQAMMHDQQIRPGRDGEFYRGQACVHGGGQAADRAAILHLQTVGRAVIIAKSLCAQDFVAVGDDGGQQGF